MRRTRGTQDIRWLASVAFASLAWMILGAGSIPAATIQIDGVNADGRDLWSVGGVPATSVAVNPGDTVIWRAVSGRHGVVFDTQAAAEGVLQFRDRRRPPAPGRPGRRGRVGLGHGPPGPRGAGDGPGPRHGQVGCRPEHPARLLLHPARPNDERRARRRRRQSAAHDAPRRQSAAHSAGARQATAGPGLTAVHGLRGPWTDGPLIHRMDRGVQAGGSHGSRIGATRDRPGGPSLGVDRTWGRARAPDDLPAPIGMTAKKR